MLPNRRGSLARWARCARAACALLPLSGAFAYADTLTLLATAKHGTFLRGGPATGSARVHVGRDPGLASLVDPTSCPQNATIQIRGYSSATGLLIDAPAIPLACDGWVRSRGGYTYRDAAAGVTRIRYGRDGLDIRLDTPAYVPFEGPVGFVQVWLVIGDVRYHVRFHAFRRNTTAQVVARTPSAAAARAELAFWAVLFGDDPDVDGAFRALAQATRRSPRDGYAHFLTAMLHLYRFGTNVGDYPHAPESTHTDVIAARAAFATAVPLLWDGHRGDSRVPGFQASTTYVTGVLTGDADLRQQGLQEIATAAAANPLFNSFNELGAVVPVLSFDDPALQETITRLDSYFPVIAAQCGNQQETCFNAGLAPHNLEGTFLLFGDAYAKSGRTADAASYYASAVSTGGADGWRPSFLQAATERAATVAERVARFRDGDPGNDPPLLGIANGACAYCHHR